jgi:hypothetical protein
MFLGYIHAEIYTLLSIGEIERPDVRLPIRRMLFRLAGSWYS